MLRFTLPALVGLSAIAVATSALPDDLDAETVIGDLTITQPYAHATPPNATVGGAYMLITNGGATDDRLVAGNSPVGMVEIHEMSNEDGIMRMAELEEGLVIPAGGSVELKRGGLHVMFLGLKAPFADGDAVPLTLEFEGAGTVEVEVAVTPRDALPAYAAGGAAGDGHSGHDHAQDG